MIDIKDIQGNTRLSIGFNPGAKGKFSMKKEDYIVLPFNSLSPIGFQVGDYVDLRGVLDDSMGGKLAKIYDIVDVSYPKYNTSTAGYEYELRLDAYYIKWKTKIFKYTPEVGGQEASWNLTASLDVQMGVFLRNLKALGYTYEGKDFEFSIDSTVENSAKLMSYDNTNLLDAVFSMADKWGCDCWVTDHVINFGRCEFSDAVTIELGKEANDMTRSNSKGTYATRIYPFGSTRNIPTNYRPVDSSLVVGGIVQKRLMLPVGTPCIDAYEGLTDLEAVEAVVVFDDLYPHRVGTISNVTSYESEVENEDGTKTKATFYRFKDSGINFSKDYILERNDLKIKFESGKLNCMEFGVTFNPLGLAEKNPDGSWNPDAQLWEIVLNKNYGRPLPDEVLFPEDGDTYVLSGWNAEKIAELGLIASAEQELLAVAKKYLTKLSIDDGTYTATLNSDWVHEDQINHSFDIGQRINLINPAYFKNGRQSRVIGFEIKLDIPYDSPQYTIGESAAYSRISDIEGKVEELTFKGQTFTSSGGSNIYVIKTNDSTAASNFNVFSALRTLRMFLRKNAPDEAEEIITFLKGLLIGKNGSGITVRQDGTSQAVVDRLYVKIKAVFDELQVKKATHVGGEQIITHAGMKCIRVEELEDVYRCYFLAEQDGEAIANEFSVGSLAQAKECNIVDGTTLNASNRYYWREVMEVGRDYIDLSKTICDEGSDAPAAGDDIIGLGHRKDTDLQNAIVLSSTNETSPSITFYTGINDFNLTEKDIISFGVNKSTGKAYMKVYGDAYIGARDERTYIKYTDKNGVEIKGKFISATTGKNIDTELDEIDADIADMRNVTDKIMVIWEGDYLPTLTNAPASDWVEEESKVSHEQDLFYNVSKNPAVGGGRCYRWEVLESGTYGWNEITDKDTIAALEAAASKKRIFVTQPTIDSDYDIGDMWVNATYSDLYDNDSLVCFKAKKAGEAFNIAHWRASTKVTSAYIKQMEDRIEAAVLVTDVDKDGNIISTNKNGLVLTKDFSALMSSYADDAGIVSKAEIATFISDSNGNFTSNAVIRADKIDFIGKTMINGKFVVDTNGHVTMTDFTANNGVFNGTVNAIDGTFNGTVNATSGSFRNVSVSNINSPGDPFYIDALGYLHARSIEVDDATISGDITATNATFKYGTFENITLKKSINTPSDNLYIDASGAVTVKGVIDAISGVFENITLKKNINTPDDNLYIDASGSVTVRGVINATSGSFENITLNKNINTPADNLYIDASGAVIVKGTVNATSGSFENITLKKNINTPEDNFYVDATGAVTVNGTVNATSGSFENVTVKNVNTATDPFYIDAFGIFHGKDVVVESGTFSGTITSESGDLAGWLIETNSIYKNNVYLGADGSIYNKNGAWYLGNDKTGYLANGNVTWDAAGNVVLNNMTANNGTFNGRINASGGQIGNDLYLHGNGISTNEMDMIVDFSDQTSQFSLSKTSYMHGVLENGWLNLLTIRPYCPNQDEVAYSTFPAILSISAEIEGRKRAIHVSHGSCHFGGDVTIAGPISTLSESQILYIDAPVSTRGAYQNTKTVSTSQYTIQDTDHVLLFSVDCSISLPYADGREIWVMPNNHRISFPSGSFANSSRTYIDGYEWHVMKRIGARWYLSWMTV